MDVFEELMSGLEFEEPPFGDVNLVSLKEDVVLQKDVSIKISEQVVDVLSSAPDEVISILGANEIVRVPMVEKRWFEIKDEILHVEGELVIDGLLEQLRWAEVNNITLFRKLVFDKYEELLCMAESAEVVTALRIYRMMRSVTPVLNNVTKRVDVLSVGNSTLGKVRSMLDFAGRQGLIDGGVVAFGVAGYHHAMGYHPLFYKCVDPLSLEENFFFQRGKLEDWREHVLPGDFIFSDASVNNEDCSGMMIPDHFYDHYKDMIAAGHSILVKVDKLGQAYSSNWKVMSISYYREHNLEAFVLISKDPKDNNYEMRDFDHEGMVRKANDTRMRLIMQRHYEVNDLKLNYTEGELEKAFEFGGFVYKKGLKPLSVIDDIVGKFGCVNRYWKFLCNDRNATAFVFDEYLTINLELPVVLFDVGFISRDKDRLFASFFAKFTMEFDEEFGWVAVKFKDK